MTAFERFMAKIERGPNGCWLWNAHLSRRGYGRFMDAAQRKVQAHRWSYEYHREPIPTGLTLDHLCRNRACVNPAHLEPATNRVNILRGEGITARQARQTHCKNGHPFDLLNTRWEAKGSRRCRICDREYNDTRRPGRGSYYALAVFAAHRDVLAEEAHHE